MSTLTPEAPRISASIEDREQQFVIGATALVGAAGAMTSEATPTGVSGWDPLLLILLGAAVVVAATRAERWTLLLLSGLALVFSGFTAWSVLAGVALIAAIASSRMRRRNRLFNAVIAAIALQALLRLPPALFWGLPSIVASAAILPIFVSSFRKGTKAWRRRMRWIAGGVAVAAIVGAASFGLTIANTRAPAEQGIDAARDGLVAARRGDQATTVQLLAIAARSLDDANGAVTSTFALPARLTPVSAQHLRALEIATDQGTKVAVAAQTAAGSADVRRLQVDAGQVDLTVLDETRSALAGTNTALVEADEALASMSSDWLVPPLVAAVDDLRAELADGLEESQLGEEALTVVPRLLGSEGEHRYLVLLATPAETREAGGFVGAYALLSAADGRLELLEADRIAGLFDRVNGLDGADFSSWYRNYDLPAFPQNLTSSPDPLTVMRATQDVFPSLADAPIDGVMYLDPYATAAFVELLGGIDVPELGRTLTPDETLEFLLREQYLSFDSTGDRKEFLVVLLQRVFAQVIATQLPGPERLGAIFGPPARAGNLSLATIDDEANDFLRRIQLLKDFPAPDGADFLSVVQTNPTASKLDAYLTRDVDYSVRFDPATGALASTVKVTLQSSATTDLPSYVTGFGIRTNGDLGNAVHRTFLGVYTPHEVTEIRVDGESTFWSPVSEYGYNRPVHQVEVQPGATVVVEYDLEGSALPGSYSLTVANQALATPDQFHLEVTAPEEWKLAGEAAGTPVTFDFELVEDTRILVGAERS